MLFLIFLVIVALWLFHEMYWRRRKLPPGPMPWPLVGNLPQILAKQPGFDAYLDWEKQYGPVYTYYLGNMACVTITDYDLLKKYIVNQGEKFSDRYHLQEFVDMYRGGNYGIIEADGDFWVKQRRFAISTLRDFGMGKNIMEQRVCEEIDHMFEIIEKSANKLTARRLFTIGVGNIINSVLFGYRFDEKNEHELWKIRDALTRQQTEFMGPRGIILFHIPFTRRIPGFRGLWQRLEIYRDELFGFFQKQIDDHLKEIDFESEESNDIMEVYLKEQRKHRNEPDEGGYSQIQLRNIVFDIWIAGLETTTTTLMWGVNFLLNHEGVMERMQKELDRVVGQERKVEMNDRNQLHYCQAVISEIQRFLNLLPQNLFRVATEDVQVEEHFVEKGTIIIPQISCVLYNEKIFPEARKFKPERFLNEDGTYKKYQELIPFSLGKRQCAGEGLARLELFLFFTNIIHKYEITSDEKPTMERSFKTLIHTPDYTCNFKPRF
ncbi:unnamed protein product, partial [Mesorhabditis belari]|uniref:CYtochrome P450 family n=1 Tax=Mesorhabditis belari TaxID=2138241 RepID=A0AAF3EGY0_9BILA